MSTVSSKLPLEKLNILAALSAISQTINSALPLDDMLHSLVALTVQFLEADSCMILSLDAESGQLTLRASAPSLAESVGKALPIDVDTPDWRDLIRRELLQFQPPHHQHAKTLLSAHLTVGTEYLGEIHCYLDMTHTSMPEAQMLLTTIANQIALAIKQRQLMDIVAQRSRTSADVHQEAEAQLLHQASLFGCDLNRTHTIALIELHCLNRCARYEEPGEKRFAIRQRTFEQIQERIQASYPGSLTYIQNDTLICVICLSNVAVVVPLDSCLQDIITHLQSERQMHLAIGIGNPCLKSTDYGRGLAEATEALHIGQNTKRSGGTTRFNELGADHYLYHIARSVTLTDPHQEKIARIADYDFRKDTNLLHTLETYLECGGSITTTASELKIHRNTLLQRIDRLQSLCLIDLHQRRNWFTLQLAIKVYKLRAVL